MSRYATVLLSVLPRRMLYMIRPALLVVTAGFPIIFAAHVGTAMEIQLSGLISPIIGQHDARNGSILFDGEIIDVRRQFVMVSPYASQTSKNPKTQAKQFFFAPSLRQETRLDRLDHGLSSSSSSSSWSWVFPGPGLSP